MSAPINDGGPAFPQTKEHQYADGDIAIERTGGMSLRDWFAGQIAGGDAAAGDGWVNNPSDAMVTERAKTYLKIADAMLTAREAHK